MKPGNKAARGGAVFYAAIALLLTSSIFGCAPQNAANSTGPISSLTFKVNGNTTDEAGMLAARQSAFDKQVAGVTTESDPLKGSAVIVLPDHDRLRPLVAQQQTIALKRPVTGQALESLVDEEQQGLHELANAIVKNGAFQTVTVQERNDVLNPPDNGADYVIWFQVRTVFPNNTGTWLGTWLVRRKGNTGTQGASLDPGTAPGPPRLASFVKSVREASLRLGGTSVAGATAASLPAAIGFSGVTSGSGIVVDKQGGILTNAHVVGCTDPTVIDASNAKFPAHIVTKDQANDLAFLKTDHRWPQAASFRDGNDIRVGESIFAVGFPLTGLVSSSSIVTTGSVNAIAGPRDDSRLMQISAPIQPGNSGGAVLDNDGHVIGVVTSELNGALLTLLAGISPQNVNFALKSVIVRNFLYSQGVEFAHAASNQGMSSADVGALARRISVRVQCGG